MKISNKNNTLTIGMARLLICGLLIYAFGFALWTIFFTETGNGDNVEHLHATWLVANGKVPYRDFFQHHNPLLWYLFAPVVYLFTDTLTLLDVAHALGVIGGILTFFVVYKICRRFFDVSVLSALTSLLILCPPYYYIYCFNYNPDTFMALFFACGLYFLLYYWHQRCLWSICLSFGCFFISFLFTQKILIACFILGILSLYVFYRQKSSLQDIFLALLLPLLGLLAFIALLYHAGALKLYWLSNYPFNVLMQSYYGYDKISVIDYQMLYPSCILSCLGILCLFYKENTYFKLIALLFISELILRCFYFSISPYYLLPLMVYCCILNGVFIEKMRQKNIVVILLLCCLAIYFAFISKSRYLSTRTQDRSFAQYISRNLTPCDYVLSSYFGNQSIISKDPHYYWSMLGHIDIAGEKLGIAPKPNVNELVLRYKPKFIYGGVYWNSYAKHRRKDVFIQQVDKHIIDTYYNPSPFSDFYILKPELREKNCRYNTHKKEWLYEN